MPLGGKGFPEGCFHIGGIVFPLCSTWALTVCHPDSFNPLPLKEFAGQASGPQALASSLHRVQAQRENGLTGDRGRGMDWINQRVHFTIRDVYHPDPMQLILVLHGHDLLTGTIIALSDSGMQKNAFAVIEVEGIQELLVVPIERIQGASEEENASEPL